MYRPRVIPVLLLKNGSLVKTIAFRKERYIGDPINALNIFNAMKADEIILLDIEASKNKQPIDLELVKKIGEEAFMPFSVGGGIRTCEQIAERIALGAEKVILNSIVFEDLNFVKKASLQFGASTLVCCMDIKKNWLGKYKIVTQGGQMTVKGDIVEWAKQIETAGIGEIIIQSVDRDGTMNGYDLELIKLIATQLTIPVSVLGGAANIESMKELIDSGLQINGLAAGSMFVYHGPRRGVLINYPSREKINQIFNQHF
jgi:imidazole glycerol-phosphate synthase subunit HisF